MTDFTVDDISALLTDLGARLTERKIEGEIYVAGGVAMLLAYHREGFPRKIDQVFALQEEVEAEVRAMAADHADLEPDWLNARVLPLLPRGTDGERLQVLGGPGLTVNVASPNWLLAMKARAARDERDLDDIWVLCQILGLRATEEVWAICDDVWGEEMVRQDVIHLVTTDLKARGLR